MKSSTVIRAGCGECMQYLAHEHNDNTIRFLLIYPGTAPARMLEKAVHQAVMGADILHASFHPAFRMGHWHVHPDVTAAECFTHVQCAGDVRACAMELSAAAIQPGDRCKMHLTLCQGEKEYALVLRVSHLCADGGDSRYLLGCVLENVRRLQAGGLPPVSIKNGNRSATQVYRHLSKEQLRPLLCNPMGGVKSCFRFDDPAPGTPRMLAHDIPADVMLAAHDKACAMDATVNDVLLCACYRAYARVMGETGPISIVSMTDLRRHLPGHDSPGLANLAGSLPTCVDKVEGAFMDTLRMIARQTRAVKDRPLGGAEGLPLLHAGVHKLPMPLLLRFVGRIYRHMSVGMTNLGRWNGQDLLISGQRPLQVMAGSVSKYKPNMQICVVTVDDRCTMTVTGCYSDADARQIECFLQAMRQEISQFI